MKILLVGGGGREHAIAWALTRDPDLVQLTAVPGNPGIAALPGARCLQSPGSQSVSSPEGLSALADLAESESIDLTIVGPEDPLVMGISNVFANRGMRVFGPSGDAARLEGSKQFAKKIMQAQGVPTAAAQSFAGTEAAEAAKAYLKGFKGPWVVKADGLAAGKGVLVTSSIDEAADWIDDCLLGSRFGAAGSSVLIEEYLDGPELSLLCMTDGREILPLPPARDHKRLHDGDEGPNTGGMGAYSPVPDTDDLTDRILDAIVEPVVAGLRKAGTEFKGVLYTGLVLTDEGPKVLEFNVRFGDPETQAVLPRIDCDLVEIMLACTEGRLGQVRAAWKPESCVTVVAAASGYPESPRKGDEITGLEACATRQGVMVFHAGTALDADVTHEGNADDTGESTRLLTSGGRVLAVSALGAGLGDARDRAYAALGDVHFDGMQFRTDIAESAVQEGGSN